MTGFPEKKTVYAIVGQTAVGKTRAGFELAADIGAEIVSVDSRQVYRYLDVGTDKISREARKIVPHHLIDTADPDEVFTAADFVGRAESAIARISSRGRIPLLVGGTPLYYRALEGRMLSESMPKDPDIRKELEASAESYGTASLHGRLAEVDPLSAARIHKNDKVRLVRALELYSLTGRSATELYMKNRKLGASVEILYFGIDSPRALLYERIERRVAEQFHAGYPEEVKWLLDNGYSRDLPALQGFGYKELVLYLDGRITFDEAMQGDVKATKAFARRQTSWFKHFYPIIWYNITHNSIESAVNDMKKTISEKNFKLKAEPGPA
ncbi:MAG: tRNA (adenosine(37)-N6)-dimethylallyltransferase MiaA [Synergistaceae bacterium]|jgi:tRNA dimethylallyltransferase|nr:tRNA (adenosine(37)-N6)-dimethylallyltransferase MiaA [Synergistaceae bacterium]